MQCKRLMNKWVLNGNSSDRIFRCFRCFWLRGEVDGYQDDQGDKAHAGDHPPVGPNERNDPRQSQPAEDVSGIDEREAWEAFIDFPKQLNYGNRAVETTKLIEVCA